MDALNPFVSNRRYGKTSLLRRFGRDAEKIGMHYVEVDFYGVLSESDVAERLEQSYSVLRSRPGELARSAIHGRRGFELEPLTGFDIAEYVGQRFCWPTSSGSRRRSTAKRMPSAGGRTVTKVFAEQDEALRATWDSLETKEQAVYAALAGGPAGLFAEQTLTRFNLSKSSARYAREALVRGGQVRKVDGRWQPVDPLLARWVVELQHNGSEDLLR